MPPVNYNFPLPNGWYAEVFDICADVDWVWNHRVSLGGTIVQPACTAPKTIPGDEGISRDQAYLDICNHYNWTPVVPTPDE